MARILWSLIIALALLPVEAPAQVKTSTRVAIGGGAGVVGGVGVTMAIVVARARFQREYLDSAEDLVHWQSIPTIAAPAVGMVFGLAGEDALRGSIRGSLSGIAVGATTGALLGWVLSDEQEWPWAAGVIGAGLGLTVGGLVEGLRAWSKDDDPSLDYPKFLRFGISVPVR